MRRPIQVFVLAGTLIGCGGDDSERGALLTDTLTRRQRDSIIAGSKLPGAGAVDRALKVADSVSARAGAIDSMLTTPREP